MAKPDNPEADGTDSVTEVAEESFVRERAADIEKNTVLAGRYQIEEIIGRGGSGVVLRAFDRTAQALVALKVLKSELASDAKWARRFSRELRLGRPVQHPNVCRIFDIGEADGHRFLTMELARGGTLRDQLKRGESATRSWPERLVDAEAVIAGLAAIHGVGIVHRDFKPDNLLRMEDGRLVLSDFGLATDTANAPGVTVLIGTPHYMAPEVLAGEPATTRSDVWALGVVLHEIFFGRRPERRATSFDGTTKPSPRAESPTERAMLALCEHCLADAPLDRPADAGAVMRLFEAARLSPHSSLSRRGPRWYLIATGVGLVTLALAGVLASNARRKSPIAPLALTRSNLIRLEPTGEPADWSKVATVVTEVPGPVHCFSMVDQKTARLIWGMPPHAEDVDIASGQRRAASLARETYASGCPDLSPKGDSLLFTAQNAAGTSEIRMSRPDGSDAKVATSGSDPLWLHNGEEFLYDIDSTHAAIFSLPTMALTLLPDPHLGGRQAIVEKAVHATEDIVALSVFVDTAEPTVAFYEGRAFEHQRNYVVPSGHRIQFGGQNDGLLISYQSGATSTLAELDWRNGAYRNLGRYPGFDLVGVRDIGGRAILLARHVSKDIWLYDGDGGHSLTSDGVSASAAISPTGGLLISKMGDDGNLSIWSREPDGSGKRLTVGPFDVSPDFSSNGQWWTYADYAQKSIMICGTEGASCRVLRRDDQWPTSPRFSPDGSQIAYVTQMGAPQLTIITVRDGHIQQSWDAFRQCPPIWSSPVTIWSFEALGDHYRWAERDTTTGRRTGKRIEVLNRDVALSEFQCFPGGVSPGSPFFQRVRVEKKEVTRLLALPSAWRAQQNIIPGGHTP